MKVFYRALSIAGLAAFLTVFSGGASSQAQQTPLLQTPAERTNYQQGGTLYAPLMDFVYDLQSKTDLMNVQKLTQTLLGRDIVLCILSNPPVFTPEDVQRSGKPVVLIVNNVHGNEVAGKDASMEIMRDLGFGNLRPLLDQVVVLNVPTINPDGAEVRRRTNEQNFDLNRDYIKLESQEISAIVTGVLNRWNPDIWVDTHHGGATPYTLTYRTNMNPAGDSELVRFGNDILMRVRRALRAENYDSFWYSGPGRVNGVDGWNPTSVEPRKQHVYGSMANIIGFLFETPAGTHRVADNGTRVTAIPREETYRHQVRGQYIGQRELLRFAAAETAALKKVIADARQRAIVRGSNDSDNDQVPIEYRQTSSGNDSFWVRRAAAPAGSEFELINGPVFTKFETTRTTTRPWGYLLPPSLAKVVPILLDHQIAVNRLTAPLTVEIEAYYASEVKAEEYFQGHYLRTVKVTKRTERVEMPAGSLFIPSSQPRSNLISYLLEPETDDNLVTWGYLDDFVQLTPPSNSEPAARIPIYRLMKKTNMKAVLVESAGTPRRNLFYR